VPGRRAALFCGVTMHPSRPAANVAGILLFLTGVLFFAINDALGKWLVADYGVAQLMLLRTTGAAAVLALLIVRTRPSLRLEGQWGLHLVRVACMTGDTFAFYFATRDLPLADVMTFYMAAPLIITALSVPFLGERVGLHRWSAILVGFAGVLVALRPTEAAISQSALVALFGATMFAFAITITRKLRDTHWLPLVSWQFAGAGLVGAVLSPLAWVTPGPTDLALMFLVGIVAMVCFICITKALALAPASVLAPFQYTSIVWAALLGWMIWGDEPTLPIAVGNAIIIASGLYVFYRERVKGALPPRLEPIP
jgi:S-adenosylmethionine uptake transporter